MIKFHTIKTTTHTIKFKIQYSAGHFSQDIEVLAPKRMSVEQATKHLNTSCIMDHYREHDILAKPFVIETTTTHTNAVITEVVE